jgi:hypothetical protein
MRPTATNIVLAILLVMFCSVAHSAESLDEYLVSLDNELHASPSTSPGPVGGVEKPPSLDAKRLLGHSHSIIHAATPTQWQRLSDALIAFLPRYAVPASVPVIPDPLTYLAFTEMQVVYSEILDRSGSLQRAHWFEADQELLDAEFRRLCSAPSILDFYRRVLDGEMTAGRLPAAYLPQARALSERLAQRSAWYADPENQSTCRDLSNIKVAP